MYAKKLKLENDIYFRAACLGVSIEEAGGYLRTASADGYLCALIRVYNRFFGTENQASSPLSDGVYQSFKNQQTYLPLLSCPAGGALFACDFPAALAAWQTRGNGPALSKRSSENGYH